MNSKTKNFPPKADPPRAEKPRPPIVVVMGHIDHGKSKLLDYIRKSSIVEGEAGGITQHIGAYEAEVKCSLDHKHGVRKITFLDTPGHEAFSQMRQRGARIADIAILVVAADEGPKPQTIEAYEAIQKANIPFVIALNKIDKPNADPERIKMQLAEKQILVEGYGGSIPVAKISAKIGEGVDELLDMVMLLADMENLSANPEESASGVIIESHLDPQRGITATLLIENGTMKKGMCVASGNAIAPVRIFEDFLGQPLEEATFSSPVRIVGFSELPIVGEKFKTFSSKKEAEEAVASSVRVQLLHFTATPALDTENKITIPLILKTDVSGSLEALEKEILKTEKEGVALNIIRKDIGNITEDDAKLASSAKRPIMLGFNVNVEPAAKEIAERFGISVFTSDIIYRISEWLEEEIGKRLEKEKGEEISGSAKILKTFSRAKTKQVIGGMVLTGRIPSGGKFKIKRNEAEIGEGKILELQRNKMATKEVTEGNEFGAMIETKTETEKDDVLEFI